MAAMQAARGCQNAKGNPGTKLSPERFCEIRSLFELFLEVEPAKPSEWLLQQCSGDFELLREVKALLDADRLAGDSSDWIPSCAESGDEPSAKDLAGHCIDNYQIIREIGRGGMSTVYLARRADELYSRQVALKVLRPERREPDLDRRFRREREIIARLEHPNIARLLDGGTTVEGLPYSVMEYVEGEPINVYCDKKRLNVTERIQCFLTVCAAVQYAHQNLVIHRDLKPSNILVSDDGTVKLLDFGIAKLIGMNPQEALTDGSLGFLIMTPAYASPEQISGQQINTCSDVYSLGVVLYELLTGQKPYRTQGRLPHEVARDICEQTPPRPSETILQEPEEDIDSNHKTPKVTREWLSEVREGKVAKLQRRLAGELDNIILMALRKEPQRRYRSVEQFSEDLHRHISGLPILAQNDTLLYRMQKFVRRHRAGVAATLFAMLSMSAAVVSTTWQARVARQERIRAETQAIEAKLQSERAELRTREAQMYQKRAEREAAFAKEQLHIAEERKREASAKSLEAAMEREKANRRARQVHAVSEALLGLNDYSSNSLPPGIREGAITTVEQTMSALLSDGYDNALLRKDLDLAQQQLGTLDCTRSKAAIEVRPGWFFTAPEYYQISFEKKDGQAGSIACIRSRYPLTQGSAELEQPIDARPFRGKRILVSAALKSGNKTNSGRIFARIIDTGGKRILYETSKATPGSPPDWSRHEVVFDVPETSSVITIGFMLEGTGPAWAHAFSFEAVDRSVPLITAPQTGALNSNNKEKK